MTTNKRFIVMQSPYDTHPDGTPMKYLVCTRCGNDDCPCIEIVGSAERAGIVANSDVKQLEMYTSEANKYTNFDTSIIIKALMLIDCDFEKLRNTVELAATQISKKMPRMADSFVDLFAKATKLRLQEIPQYYAYGGRYTLAELAKIAEVI